MNSERSNSNSRTPRQTLVNLTQSQEYQVALLDQQIISTLQNIDRIFVTCHDLIQNDLIPCVEEYTGSCREILAKSKVWLDFFDHLVNSLPQRAISPIVDSDTEIEHMDLREDSPEFIAPTSSMATRAVLQSFRKFKDVSQGFESSHAPSVLESSPIASIAYSRPRSSLSQSQALTEPDLDLTMSSPSFLNLRATPSFDARFKDLAFDRSSSPVTNYIDLERVSSRLSNRALAEENSFEQASSRRAFSAVSDSPSPDLVPVFTPRARTSLRDLRRQLVSPNDSSTDLSSLGQRTPEQDIIEHLRLNPDGLPYGALHAALQHIPLDALRKLLYILEKRKTISILNNIVTLIN